MKDATTWFGEEEYVSNTGHPLNDVARKDVQTMPREEEYVLDMVHHGQERLVAIKDVPPMCRMEEFVSDMVQK